MIGLIVFLESPIKEANMVPHFTLPSSFQKSLSKLSKALSQLYGFLGQYRRTDRDFILGLDTLLQ